MNNEKKDLKQLLLKILILCSIFLVSLIIFYNFGKIRMEKQIFSGDEPHYLLIAKSLVRDKDFDLTNNYDQRDYQEFGYDYFDNSHLSVNSPEGKLYSIHHIGLSILLAPGYFLNGIRGAVFSMNIIAALSALILFLLAYKVTKSFKKSVLTWLVGFLIPLSLYSSALYTEMPLFLLSLVLIYLLLLYAKTPKLLYSLLFGFFATLILWLHIKYTLIVLVLMLAMGILFKDKFLKNIFVLILFPLISLVLELALFRHWFGSFSLSAQYPLGQLAMVNLLNWQPLAQGTIGLFLDHAFGLFVYSPIFIFSFGGLYWLWKENKKIAIGSILIFLIIWLSFGFYIKYLGWCPVGRFIMPVMPILILWLIYFIKNLKNIYTSIIFSLFYLFSLHLSLNLTTHYNLSLSAGFENKIFGLNKTLESYNHLYPLLIGRIETGEFPIFGTSEIIKILIFILAIIIINYFVIKINAPSAKK